MKSMDNNCVDEYWKNFETNKILLETYEKINKINDTYYREVHIFLNKLFNSNSKSLLKLRTSSIRITTEMLNNYNNIIKKYSLNKELFDVEKFDFDAIYDFNNIIEIALIMTNNLLHKIKYQMVKINKNDKTHLFIKKK